MKSKWVLLSVVIFCICIFCKVNAQTNTSSVIVLRGYVVRQFSREEIVNRLTLSNRNSIPIDSYQKTFFLPFGGLSLDVITDSLNVLHPNFIVFLPSKETNELIDEFCKDKTDLIVNSFPSYKSDSSYFEIKGKADGSLFQYYYIECKAIKIAIPNTSKNAFRLNIPYNKSNTNLICFFAFDTMILQPIHSINSKKIQLFEVTQKITPHESGHMLPNH